jgi:hypothetical protein
VVAWKNSEQREVSRVATIALGGLFIQTKNPPKTGSVIQLLIVTPRGYLRTRASVRNVIAGEGMGVAIVSMEPEDRGKLERWLKQLTEMEARLQRGLRPEPREVEDEAQEGRRRRDKPAAT